MLLYNVFSDYLIFGGSREVAEIPWSSIEILTRYDSANEIEDLEEWSEYIEASNLFSELFSYKANLLGENFVLKAIYQYLKKSAPECNQIEFLYRIRMLTVDNLSKSFGKKTVLDNISVQLTHGVYGLLGPNGSGKTTFMRCVAGIYRYNGRIITPSNVGYLPQKFGAFRELTVYEVLEYFAELKGIPSNRQGKDIHDCLEDVNLWERHSDKVKTLSGGMIRRLGVAQVLLGNPELILVDEPTAGLDPEERLRFKNLISQHREDCTILISTHIVEDVEALCDHIIILSHGKSICQDTPENIRKAAMKHVWHVSEKRQKELTSPYYILRREQIDGEAYLRVLSNEEQPGKSIQPTLEDGYINIIRGIR